MLSKSYRAPLLAGAAVICLSSSAFAYDGSGPSYYAYEDGIGLAKPDAGDAWTTSTLLGPHFGASPSVGLSFDGISQVTVRALESNFSEIPPDTMGAIGTSQFMETSNGAYAVYDKATGTQTLLETDGQFWANAGQPLPTQNPAPGVTTHFSNGDSRVLFDSRSSRWIVESFGANLGDIQIAVSDTSDATGTWHSTVFHGFDDHQGTAIADYPTLAIDGKAVYIGTNDFTRTAGACVGVGGLPNAALCGETLNVIKRSDLFGAPGTINTSSLKQFYTPFDFVSADRGFAIQGVNQVDANSGDAGKITAVSLYNFGLIRYDVTNPGSAGATLTPTTYLDLSPYDANAKGRQPDGTRNIDTLDDRVSSAAWEFDGRIYAVHTITPTGTDHTAVQWTISDAKTDAVIQEGFIGNNGDGFDYYQGTIVVNKHGQVVIAYNRSGFTAGDGNVTIYAQVFNPTFGGSIHTVGGPLLLHVSPINDYHNGSTQFSPAAGRQRWGDYAQVTVDPTDATSFWVIGEYALGYLPSATRSFSRWGTWISDINIAPLPEPMTIAVFGVGLAGLGALRRRRK